MGEAMTTADEPRCDYPEVLVGYWLCAGDCGQWCKGIPAAHNGSGYVCAECEEKEKRPCIHN